MADTPGAAFAPGLNLPDACGVVSKATRVEVDAYSGFDGTVLNDLLHAAGVQRVFVGGLATDYCVLFTVRDALAGGYMVCLLTDAIRAVNVKPTDGDDAVAEMISLGAVPVNLEGFSA